MIVLVHRSCYEMAKFYISPKCLHCFVVIDHTNLVHFSRGSKYLPNYDSIRLSQAYFSFSNTFLSICKNMDRGKLS